MKNNKGITLLEVIVSIVILGITIVSTIQVMATNNRVVIRNERNLNSIQEVESIMEIFSSDPNNFLNNIATIYQVEVSDKIYLYYSSAFIKNKDNSTTAYYLEVNYNKESLGDNTNKNKYTLTVNTFYDGVNYIHNNNTNNYNQRVIVK